jgi:hypothetical protein
MYLALRPPWASHSTAPAEAPVVAQAGSGSGSAKPKKQRHGGGHRRAGGGGTVGGDDPSWTGTGGDDQVQETEPQIIRMTPADRALEWRGDDTTKPAQAIDMSGNAESRSLDDGAIQSMARAT